MKPVVGDNDGLFFFCGTRAIFDMPYGTSNMAYRFIHSCVALAAFFFAALARFFRLGLGLVLPDVPREIFPRFER